jgi:hypothetical protein
MPFYHIRPVEVGEYDFWTLGAGVSKPLAVDLGEYPGVSDGDSSYVRIAASPGGNSRQSFRLGSRPKLAVLLSVKYIAILRHETIGAGIESIFVGSRADGVDSSFDSQTPGTGYTTYSQDLPKPGGGPWTIAELENPDLQLVLDVPSDNADPARCSDFIIRIEGIPADPGVGREIGTAYLRVVRRPVRTPILSIGPQILDSELMDDLSLSHYAHPLTTILGERDENNVLRSGRREWQRILVQLRAVDLNLMLLVADSTFRDRRWDLCTLYDSAESQRTSANMEDGVAILTWGGERTYTRPSRAWIEDPGSEKVTLLVPNQRPIGLHGFQPESFSAQLLQRTSAISGVTGLTSTGDGTATAESPAEDAIFEDTITDNCILLTAGNPHSTANVLEWPTSDAPPSNATLRFSIDHKDDAGAVLEWQLERTSDNDFFDDSDGTFNTTSTWNALPVRTTPFRDFSAFKIPLISGDSMILRLRQPSGGTVSRENRVYHVQLENNGVGHVTSRIVTNDFTYARELQLYEVPISGFYNFHGTFFCEFIPAWNSADMDVTGNFPAIFEVRYIGDETFDNGWLLYYNGTAGETLTFECRVEGEVYTVSIPYTAVSGQLVQIMCRWLPSGSGAFGHPAGTISVFVGTPGNVTAAHDIRVGDPEQEPGETPDPHMYVGTSPVNAAANGTLRRIFFTQQPMSDHEILAGRW